LKYFKGDNIAVFQGK